MAAENLDIRPTTADDLRPVATVHVASWQTAYRGLLPDDYLDNLSVEQRMRGWEPFLGRQNPPALNFVAVLDGAVVGICAVGPTRDHDADPGTGELYAIYLDPKIMKRGIGTAMMAYGIDHLRQAGFTKAALWVLDGNANARRFYERRGWQADGATKTEQWDGMELHEVRYVIDL